MDYYDEIILEPPGRSLLIKANDPPFSTHALDYYEYENVTEVERPYLQIHGYKRPDILNRFVKSFEIYYLKYPTQKDVYAPEPYTLLLSSLFKTGLEKYPVFRRLPQIKYENIIRTCKERRSYIRRHNVPTVYGEKTFYDYSHNVWNEYLIAEGKTTIGEMDFRAWIYRLTSLATDLLDYPFEDEPNPGMRKQVIEGFLKHEAGTHYECYNPENWYSALEATRFTAKKALKARLLDACEVYCWLQDKISPVSPLEKFLLSLADSLYDQLSRARLLKRCPECRNYFLYNHLKKRCSKVSEGIDCAKKYHNRRDYQLWRRSKHA